VSTFVVWEQQPSKDVFTSIDNGKTWNTTATYDRAQNRATGLVWDGAQFLTIFESDPVKTSPDGHTWTTQARFTGENNSVKGLAVDLKKTAFILPSEE
jgi:hypothetical protein